MESSLLRNVKESWELKEMYEIKEKEAISKNERGCLKVLVPAVWLWFLIEPWQKLDQG